MLFQTLHAQIEMIYLNFHVTLLVKNVPHDKKVWERRSHPTTPLVFNLFWTATHIPTHWPCDLMQNSN